MKFRWETEFKDTEIGQIPKDWEIKRLEEIAYINKTLNIKHSKEYRFIRMEDIPTDSCFPSFINLDIKDIKSGFEVFPHSILLAKITPSFENGKMCIVPDVRECRWFASTEVFNIYPKPISSLFFLFYLLKHPKLRDPLEGSMSGTSGRQRVQIDALKNLQIPYPPPPEQKRIATVLSWFDDLIENKKRQNEILEKTAMTIFKNWFIDFEPFKDSEFVYNEELGKEIPEGWEVKRIGEVAEIIMGQSPPSKYYNEKGLGYPFIQGKGQFGKYNPNTTIFCSFSGKISKPKDVLITVRAPVGELNIADDEYIIGRGVAILRSYYWVYYFLYLKNHNELLKSHERGTTYDAITKKELEKFPVLAVPPPILQSFHSLVEPLFQKIILNQKQIMLLRKIRDRLLPLLVFGKLRVEDI